MRLRGICSIYSGYTLRGRLEPAANGVLVIQQGDFDTNGTLDLGTLTRAEAPEGRYELKAGDVLFRSRGQRTLACVVPAALTEPAIAVMPIFIIRPMNHDIDPRYLAWTLNQHDAQLHFRQSSQGQTIQMISKRVLEDTPIVLPPLFKQRKIATIADLSARQEILERRLTDRRYSLLSLQLADAAHDFPTSPRQKRTAR
jgi:restriction endonuclease S subunit